MRVTHVIAVACFSLVATTARAQPPTSVSESLARNSASRGELLPLPQSVPGDDAGTTLTLASLKQMALQSNPTLAQARARVQAARGICRQAGLYPNPTIGYSGGEIGDEGAGGQQGGFVGQTFVTGGKLRLSQSVASQEVVRAEQEMTAQQFRVLTDVEIRFYEVLVAQQAMEISDQLVKLADEGLQAAEALLKAKEGSRVDLLQARVERNTVSIFQKNAHNRYLAVWRRLAATVGAPNMAIQRLAGDVADVDARLQWDEALVRVLSESPELAAANADVRAAQQATQRARVEWIPNVNVQATLQHGNVSGDDLVGVQVGLPLPIYNRNQGSIAAADARLVAAQRNLERVRLSLQNRLAEVYRQYANAAVQVEKYRTTILPDAKETLDLVAAGYRQGEFNYLKLLTTQRTYFQSNLAYLEALLQLKTARAQIDGLLLNNSLAGP